MWRQMQWSLPAQSVQSSCTPGDASAAGSMATMKAVLAIGFLSILQASDGTLECFNYQGPLSKCQQKQAIQPCVPSKPFCFSTLLQYKGILNGKMLTKGCSAGGARFCNQTTSSIEMELNITEITQCCDTSLCNEALFPVEELTELGELDCFVCNDDSSLCGGEGLPAVRCGPEETQCIEISIAGSLGGGERMQQMIKGCGKNVTCGGLAAFSNGQESVSYYADVQCCSGSECNSGAFSEIDPGEKNGLECYSCAETGKGECSPKNVNPMKCSGPMTRCADIRDEASGAILMSGCATEPFCQGLYPHFKMTGRNGTTCCNGSLCNRKQGAGAEVPQ